MKAIIWTKYGSPDGLQLKDVDKPIPKDDEVLVKVYATTVTAGDSELRRLKLPLMLSYPMRLYVGLIRPTRIKILGQELAGEVEAVGKFLALPVLVLAPMLNTSACLETRMRCKGH